MRSGRWDELWDYSRANIATCAEALQHGSNVTRRRAHASRPRGGGSASGQSASKNGTVTISTFQRFRYVPPGALAGGCTLTTDGRSACMLSDFVYTAEASTGRARAGARGVGVPTLTRMWGSPAVFLGHLPGRSSNGTAASGDVRGGRATPHRARDRGGIAREGSHQVLDSRSNYFDGSGRRVCFDQLQHTVGASGLVHIDNIWGVASLRRFLTTHHVFLNLHKGCGYGDAPLEALRIAPLLSVGATVVSEPSHPLDVNEYTGLIDVVPLDRMAAALQRIAAGASHPTDHQLFEARRLRAARFRRRFAPADILRRAGLL